LLFKFLLDRGKSQELHLETSEGLGKEDAGNIHNIPWPMVRVGTHPTKQFRLFKGHK
jgi:hypothetical protein